MYIYIALNDDHSDNYNLGFKPNPVHIKQPEQCGALCPYDFYLDLPPRKK